MDKKIPIIVVAAIIAIIVIVIMIQNPAPLIPTTGSSTPQSTTQPSVESTALEKCDRIEDETSRTECYHWVAASEDNIELCELGSWGESLCYEWVALASDNEQYCERLSDSRYSMNDCYTQIALSKRNPSICDNIESCSESGSCEIPDPKEECINLVNTDPQELLDQTTLSDDLRIIAFSTKNPAACAKLSSNDANNCYDDLAKITGNITFCDKISPTDYYSNSSRQNCYSMMAIIHNDISLCGDSQYFSCESLWSPSVEELMETTTDCNSLTGFNKDDCLKIMAVENKNFSYCEGVSDFSRDRCKKDVIIAIGDPSLCEVFESKYQKSPCYEEMAYTLEDSSVCNLIKDDEIIRQQCLTQLGQRMGNSVNIQLIEDVTQPPVLTKVESTTADYEYSDGINRLYFSFKSPLDHYFGIFELQDNLNYVDLRLEIPELSNTTHLVYFQKDTIKDQAVLDMAGDESDRRLSGAITISPDQLVAQSRASECQDFMNAPSSCYASEETDIAIKVWLNFRIEN